LSYVCAVEKHRLNYLKYACQLIILRYSLNLLSLFGKERWLVSLTTQVNTVVSNFTCVSH